MRASMNKRPESRGEFSQLTAPKASAHVTIFVEFQRKVTSRLKMTGLILKREFNAGCPNIPAWGLRSVPHPTTRDGDARLTPSTQPINQSSARE
jgi:hypothetical protein